MLPQRREPLEWADAQDRAARFIASRILALIEHPVPDVNIARDVVEPRPLRSSG